MSEGYFHKLHRETPTRFWVNNPTTAEAALAIEAGTEYCTTNPTYSIKMLNHPAMKKEARALLEQVVSKETDDSLAASALQGQIVGKIMDVFADIHRSSGGTKGWVSIQGDPEKEDDSDEILREAEDNRKLAPNYIAKVPVTKSGLTAIAQLASDSVPVVATEIMSLSQAVQVCEAYVDAVSGLKNPAPLYVTHITGIFDEQQATWKRETSADIDDSILSLAGFLAGREQYRVLKERKYPVTMLGGGARGLHHFTDFVGADMHITINWAGTADKLIEQSPKIDGAFFRNIEPEMIEILLDKVPDFKAAWTEEGLSVDDYESFPPVVLFRSMFLKGWKDLKEMIRENRK